MAITTIAGAYGGLTFRKRFNKTPAVTVAQQWHSMFYATGYPPAAAAPTPGIGGAVLTTYAGQIPFEDPPSGNTYIARLEAGTTPAGHLLLCDRLWHNSSIDLTSTSEQTFTGSAQIPARDATGTNAGVGVYGMIEFSTGGGAAAPTYTIKYTNQAGTPDQTATNILATANSPTVGRSYVFGLAAGDTGIRKAQSLTLSTSQLSGTAHVVLFTVLADLEMPSTAATFVNDGLLLGFNRVYDDSVPFLIFIPSGAAGVVCGAVQFTQG